MNRREESKSQTFLYGGDRIGLIPIENVHIELLL